MEDAILYAAAFDANGGVFEPLFDENDAIISDARNYRSSTVSACARRRVTVMHNDMADLETQLRDAASKRHKPGSSPTARSMDALMPSSTKSAGLRRDRYGALVLVDDSHATGFMGATGRGTSITASRAIDIITGTLGKCWAATGRLHGGAPRV